MPHPLRSFTTFTRNEKYGLATLTTVLMILLLVRVTLHYYIHPQTNPAQQARLREAWQQFQQTHADTASTQPTYVDNSDNTPTPIPATININTADSATLVRLRGIGPVTAHKILQYRTEHPFTTFDQLRKLCHLTPANTALLTPHIVMQ